MKLIDTKYENLKIMLKTTLASEKIQGLLILGKAGFGKTYQVEKFLAENEVDFHKISSYSTPLQFYKDILLEKHFLECESRQTYFLG